MARKPTKKIDYQSTVSRDLVWLAQVNDRNAVNELYSRVSQVVYKVTRNYCRRYTWIDPDDLANSLFAEKLPKIIAAYKPGMNTTWEKYAYHKITFAVKDLLRCEDPLGIGFPQKHHYPEWYRLGDEAFNSFDIADHRCDCEVEFDSDDGWWPILDLKSALGVLAEGRQLRQKLNKREIPKNKAKVSLGWTDEQGVFYRTIPASCFSVWCSEKRAKRIRKTRKARRLKVPKQMLIEFDEFQRV